MNRLSQISVDEIRSQAWKFYFAAVAWPLYLLVLPWFFAHFGIWSILLMVFPGIYLFTWVGFLMHECWHAYVPNIASKKFYSLFAYMLLTDPQIYRIAHAYHHGMVHSWEDTEFHPAGYIENKRKRQLYNLLEVVLGIAFLSVVASWTVPHHPKHKVQYRFTKALASLVILAAFIGGLVAAAHFVLGGSLFQIAVAYVLTIWINSFFLHHSQLVEHGNLIVKGNFTQRNAWTHNLNDKGKAEKVFLFFTHGDSREHVLHHTLTSIYSRPFAHRVPLPTTAVYINLKDYLGVLKRMLQGKVDLVDPIQNVL
jgi:fatty acid desaturase